MEKALSTNAAHQRGGSEGDIGEFAAAYKVLGEKIIAVDMLSRLNDRFYGQWLLLHVPFKSRYDFADEGVLGKVPPEYRYLAMALSCPHPIARSHWYDDACIGGEMRLEAHTRHHINTVVGMVCANRALLGRYMSGEIDVVEDMKRRAEIQKLQGVVNNVYGMQLNNAQTRFADRVDAAADQAMAIHQAGDEQTADRARFDYTELGYGVKAWACFGPPGTGKPR